MVGARLGQEGEEENTSETCGDLERVMKNCCVLPVKDLTGVVLHQLFY